MARISASFLHRRRGHRPRWPGRHAIWTEHRRSVPRLPCNFSSNRDVDLLARKEEESASWDVRRGAWPRTGCGGCLWCGTGCDWTHLLRGNCLLADSRTFNVFDPGCSNHSLVECFPDALVLSRVPLQTSSQPAFNYISQRHIKRETTTHRRSH
jgi:hypothetical protein